MVNLFGLELFQHSFLDTIKKRAITINTRSKKIIVFVDTQDIILQACSLMIKKNICKPLILGDTNTILASSKRLHLSITEEHIFDFKAEKHKDQMEEFVKLYVDMRKKDAPAIAIPKPPSVEVAPAVSVEVAPIVSTSSETISVASAASAPETASTTPVVDSQNTTSPPADIAAQIVAPSMDTSVASLPAITLEEAQTIMLEPHFYGTMMVYRKLADGMISGYTTATKPFQPALQIIKERDGNYPSSVFLMVKGEKVYLFADCAIHMDPTAEQLVGITLTTAETAINFGIKPRIALLSFSTHGTAKHALITKVTSAVEMIRKKDVDMLIDGELQLDAAIVPEIMKKKCPDSKLGGNANILIFPDLNAGNIAFQIAEHLGGYSAIGPILQGFNRPINDLSRGCKVDDVVGLAAITVIQSQ